MMILSDRELQDQFDNGTVIIETNTIEFGNKDFIYIKSFKDFVWLCGASIVFKLQNNLYRIAEDIVYIFQMEKEKNKNG